jgi:osmotically-inducible protein OsmY
MKALYCIALLTALAAPARASQQLDRHIELSARQSYVFSNYLKNDDIKVEAKDGAATLTGIVSEEFHKSLAQVTVEDIPGVRSVDNRLEIKGAQPTANSDAWFRAKVQATLLFHRSVRAATTGVEVKDGIVTLNGPAATQAQKELTAEYAVDVDGVKGVRNEMIVTAASKNEPRTTGEKIDDISVSALVRMALLLHRSTSALGATVTTSRGVVTVNGKAGTTAEKNRVTRIVKDVNGVKEVRNRMTVK